MIRSSFDINGLNLGQNSRDLTQLYGLSDFWAMMFEDSSNIQLLMEATSHQCSEVYSKFLQLISAVSLEDIQSTIGYQTKLVLINNTDLVQGEYNTYKLPISVESARFVANRPFLPSLTLEENVHFSFVDGGQNIRFYTDISSLGFSSRVMSDGTTIQYALWFADAEVDESLVYNFYGKLLGLTPEASTDMFKAFVYGLFYLYTQGPNLDHLRKGLNLSLGIPLARGTETVIDIRKYLDTNEYLVTTDQNSYLIPYGLPPTVAVGDVVTLSQELAQWVEVKDYISDPEWWINLQIPSSILPNLPDGVTRSASPGSYADYIMSNYLRAHTFLVNVNVVNFKNIQTFQQLSWIINQAKPTHTAPIYIWSVPIPDEILHLDEAEISKNRHLFKTAYTTVSMNQMRRDNATNPLIRGDALFIRFNVSSDAAQVIGSSGAVNGSPRNLDGGTVSGVIGWHLPIGTGSGFEQGWVSATMRRNSDSPKTRGMVSWARGFTPSGNDGATARPYAPSNPAMRIVPLYTTTIQDIQAKFSSLNITMPSTTSSFTMFKPGTNQGPNGTVSSDFSAFMKTNFNSLFTRSSNINYLGFFMPPEGYKTYTPTTNDISAGDYLQFVLISEFTWAVYWITSNIACTTIPTCFPFSESDSVSVGINSKPMRGGIQLGYSYYMLRGAGYVTSYNTNSDSNGVSQQAINSSTSSDANFAINYSDSNNPTPVVMLRDGTTVNLKKAV